MDSTTGAYQVHTLSSTYVIDLDRKVIRRAPRTQNNGGSLLRRDDELITLHEIVELTVGKSMVLLIDLHVTGVAFITRMSTPVVSIEPMASPGLTGVQ